ncbi:unnamed protein product [Blumeria hordei]|uniref:Uncharacterized protein n=1 Tax=Blumeria hordei TaxID=2867405 RepID=A0A383UPI3_BLUHO|nr:unnamed protein product [Blumeria hordei]
MIVMEGLLLAPPDRGSIIGRAAWKTRYIVLGSGSEAKTQNNLIPQPEKSAISRIGLKSSSKPNLAENSPVAEQKTQLYVSIYKSKGECEHLAQHPISAFQCCQVRSIQHRKQSPPLPTLALELKSFTTTTKQRKRRSSRSGSLITKDACPNSFLFRSVESEPYTIYDWEEQIKPLLTPVMDSIDSTCYKIPPNFTSPFTPIANATPISKLDNLSCHNIRVKAPHQYILPTKSSGLISPTPSLRSKHSDLSSKASSQPVGCCVAAPASYTSIPPPEHLPSTSTSDYENHLNESYRLAQGRSSVLSSHTRGSNSIASTTASSVHNSLGPRETILDRAFQMRYIPGSEQISSEEDINKLSSTARFEALMRENDERKFLKWETDAKETSNYVGEDKNLEDIGEDSEDEMYISDQEKGLPAPAQRALDFIAGRSTPTSRSLSPASKPAIPYLNLQALSALSGNASNSDDIIGIKPSNVTAKRINGRPASLAMPPRSLSTSTASVMKECSSSSKNSHNNKADSKEKRQSSNSNRRLSLQDFARRLSSTSSLLLVQTNTSSSPGKGMIDYSKDLVTQARGSMNRDESDRRCSWRGSVGAFSVDGSFM